ncbi:hypothetical protein B0H17DRAFT_1215225 [Mycena rosella]|uniref:CNNM transmembrane domain-containing protein n=1 Tax=Mycena rosella TaxID=1033263 RepID=A0AAD7CLF1_MYCRO|nr:hypothetical protein B0H17DRAFT_1215225 [Mycena rosella]
MELVSQGGVFAGLTLGLMGLAELHLRVLATSSADPIEQKNAKKVLALMQKGRHWVLVVLLLGSVIINESLPIFLDSAIGGGFAAVALSTTAIALSVRYGLSIGAACAPFVLALMYLFSPVAYPIAKLLDAVLGHETHAYKKEPLRDDEIGVLNGVLELNSKNVEEIMTPMKDVMTLSADAVLDEKLVETICPPQRLLKYDPALALPVSSFVLSILPEADPSINCFQALDYFQTGRAHLLLINRTPGKVGGAIGVIMLEDIIEKILSEEIVDETGRIVERRHSPSVERTPLFARSPSQSSVHRDVYGSVQ